jgi:hypothetical protein
MASRIPSAPKSPDFSPPDVTTPPTLEFVNKNVVVRLDAIIVLNTTY